MIIASFFETRSIEIRRELQFLFQNSIASGMQTSSEITNASQTEGSQPVRLRRSVSSTGRIACLSMVRSMLGLGMDSPCKAAAKTRLGINTSQATAMIRTAGMPMAIICSEALNR